MSLHLPDFGIPAVQGDPAGMRAYAARLRTEAHRIADHAHAVQHSFDHVGFRGPAKRRLMDRTRAAATPLLREADRLTALAAAIDAAAGRVERAKADRESLIHRLAAKAAEAAKRAL